MNTLTALKMVANGTHEGAIALADLLNTEKLTRQSNCGKHGDFESRNVFAGVWSRCPTCMADEKAEQVREDAERAAAEKSRLWQRRLGEAGIPERFHTRTLASYIATSAGQKSALAFATEYAEGFEVAQKEGRSAIFCGKPGTGKALSLDTPIPTPKGWTAMGEIKVGDQVFDENGQVCNVIFATDAQPNRRCFDVVFSDGTTIVADADHLWETKTHMVRYSGNAATVRTTEEIKKTLKCNHSIPVAGPLQLPDSDLSIDPYVLGVWLGDGDSKRAYLTCVEPELVQLIIDAGCTLKAIDSGDRAQRYLMGKGSRKGFYHSIKKQFIHGDSLQAELRELGVLENKHIPAKFLRASIQQRLSLLQGLMDTDGYIDPRGSGTCEFTSTIKDLAAGVFELIVSLGIKATIKESDAKLNGCITSRKWRICFTTSLIVFRLTRKAAKQNSNPRPTTTHRYITEINDAPTTPVKCIQVDSASRLYLASRAMIPTHNTHLAVGIGLHAMTLGKLVLFTTVQRAVRRVKDSWRKDSQESETDVIDMLVEPDLLILDEIGVQFGSDFEKNLMFDILNERYEKSRPSLLLSNLTATEVKAFLGERVYDRLREDGGKCIPFDWQSHRGKE